MPNLSVIFFGIALIFAALTGRDYVRNKGKLSPSSRTWLLITLIFSAVSFLLYSMGISTSK
jgi:hypothetical protein